MKTASSYRLIACQQASRLMYVIGQQPHIPSIISTGTSCFLFFVASSCYCYGTKSSPTCAHIISIAITRKTWRVALSTRDLERLCIPILTDQYSYDYKARVNGQRLGDKRLSLGRQILLVEIYQEERCVYVCPFFAPRD